MHRLDDQRRVGPEHPPELAEHRQIPFVAPVADRAEEIERAVELRVGEGKLAQVAFNEHRIVPRAGPGPRLAQLIRRQVDANHVVAGIGERDRMATEAAGRIEHAGAGSDAGERHRGERLVPGGLLRELRAVRPQVVAIEETATTSRRARSRLQLLAQALVDDLRVRLALGRLHHLTDEEAEQPVLAAAVGVDLPGFAARIASMTGSSSAVSLMTPRRGRRSAVNPGLPRPRDRLVERRARDAVARVDQLRRAHRLHGVRIDARRRRAGS